MDGQNYNGQENWNNQSNQGNQGGQGAQNNPYGFDANGNGQFGQSNYDNGQNPYTQNHYYRDDSNQGQNPYFRQQNSYQQRNSPNGANTISIVGMVLGIISIPVGCCFWYGLIFSIPGLICSIIGYKQTRSGVALAGIICSIIGAVFTVITIILYVIGVSILRTAHFFPPYLMNGV